MSNALDPFLQVMRLFCLTERDLVEWGEKNKDEIRAKLTEGEQAQLRQEFKIWRERLRESVNR